MWYLVPVWWSDARVVGGMTLRRNQLTLLVLANSAVWSLIAYEGAVGALRLG
jgi:hypothetical protein